MALVFVSCVKLSVLANANLTRLFSKSLPWVVFRWEHAEGQNVERVNVSNMHRGYTFHFPHKWDSSSSSLGFSTATQTRQTQINSVHTHK